MNYSNSSLGNNPPARTGLSVQELKQLTALRMSQAHVNNEGKNRSGKDASGHPPRNPVTPPMVSRQAPITYQAPIESKSKSRHDGQHTKANKPKGRGRTSPVDTSVSMPHGLTVQELKELTRIRLAREAMSAYSPETSDYSDTRTHTTTATFRSGYSGGDVDSYSDSGSVPRNRSTSTSPISNTDSDSFEEGLPRYAYHPPIPISPSSLGRDRQISSYSPDNSNDLPLGLLPQAITIPPHLPVSNNPQTKYVSGIHPGLQQKTVPPPLNHRSPHIVPTFASHDIQITLDGVRNHDLPSTQAHVNINSQRFPPSLASNDRETMILPLGSSGNSLRKFALTNTVSSFEGGYDPVINGSPTPPLNPLFSFVTPSMSDLSPPGSPQRSFRGKKKLVIDCPAPVRIRSSSDCNELAFEMAEAVLNSPGPNSPLGSSKPIWSDPPSRRTSVCSVHSDTGIINGILHDTNGIGLVPPQFCDHTNAHLIEDPWSGDADFPLQKNMVPMSPVTRTGATNNIQSLETAFNFLNTVDHNSFCDREFPPSRSPLSEEKEISWR